VSKLAAGAAAQWMSVPDETVLPPRVCRVLNKLEVLTRLERRATGGLRDQSQVQSRARKGSTGHTGAPSGCFQEPACGCSL